MKTIIIYAPGCKCIEKISEQMKSFLGEKTAVVSLKKSISPVLKEYDRIIVGGSIKSGQIQKRIQSFCSENLNELLEKELGLFICTGEFGFTAQNQLEESFPEELLTISKASAAFGGTADTGRFSFLENMLKKKEVQIKKTSSKVDFEAVRAFSKTMDRIFNPFLFLA